MTSRERILTALRRGTPDRVPISTYELVGYNSKAFENNDPSYTRLMDTIREKTDCLCMWDPTSNATFLQFSRPVEMQVQETREDDAIVRRKTLHTPQGALTQTIKIVHNVHTIWQTEHWCKNLADVERALSIPYEPLEYDFSDYARIAAEVGDNGVIMSSVADPLWLAADLMSFGDYTVWARTETGHFIRALDIMHERAMDNLPRMLDARVVDVYRICGPEYATPPYLPRELFQRFVVPYVAEMVDLIHDRGAFARFHCHGRIGQVLDMIMDTGSDAVDPCEAPPDGDVTLDEVKKRCGSSMCIFGNIQLRLLECGSPDDIEQAVINCMAGAKAGGGYVIMPTAAPISSPLQPKTEDNYVRFIDVALKHGKY